MSELFSTILATRIHIHFQFKTNRNLSVNYIKFVNRKLITKIIENDNLILFFLMKSKFLRKMMKSNCKTTSLGNVNNTVNSMAHRRS